MSCNKINVFLSASEVFCYLRIKRVRNGNPGTVVFSQLQGTLSEMNQFRWIRTAVVTGGGTVPLPTPRLPSWLLGRAMGTVCAVLHFSPGMSWLPFGLAVSPKSDSFLWGSP